MQSIERASFRWVKRPSFSPMATAGPVLECHCPRPLCTLPLPNSHLQLKMRGSAAQLTAFDGLLVRAPPPKRLGGAYRPPRQHLRHLRCRQQLRLCCVNRATSDPLQQGMAMADQSQPSAELDSLLAHALPSPRYIRFGGAAAVVALAAHSESFLKPAVAAEHCSQVPNCCHHRSCPVMLGLVSARMHLQA